VSLDWKQLQALIGVDAEQESTSVFIGVNSLRDAGPGEISFLGNARYEHQLATTGASLVLVPPGDFSGPDGCRLILVENPSVAFSKIIGHFQTQGTSFEPGVSPGAHLAGDVDVDPLQVQIAPGAVIESGARIGAGSVIGAGCLIGKGVVIGADCLLHAGAIIRERCTLGDRVILQPGCVIGSDGYGFDLVDGRFQKVPQVGIVEIQDDVEIGAGSCVDRARFGKTVVGEGTKVDNLVQIAHNVQIGKHCLLVAQSGIAGSARLGDYVTIAAQSGVAGHLDVADQAVLATKSALLKSITKAGVYMGTPARPIREAQRKLANLARLPKLRDQVHELKKKLEEPSGE
jgi:UDP-3-O-[3-hydroxymyristoyl] glucosamine N-acyltransferase